MRSCTAVGLATMLLAGAAQAAPDMVLLQQTLEPNRAGGALIMLDRNRVATVTVDKAQGPEHTVSITMDRDQKPRYVLRCVDVGAARQVLDGLKNGGPPQLDITGRCRF